MIMSDNYNPMFRDYPQLTSEATHLFINGVVQNLTWDP